MARLPCQVGSSLFRSSRPSRMLSLIGLARTSSLVMPSSATSPTALTIQASGRDEQTAVRQAPLRLAPLACPWTPAPIDMREEQVDGCRRPGTSTQMTDLLQQQTPLGGERFSLALK